MRNLMTITMVLEPMPKNVLRPSYDFKKLYTGYPCPDEEFLEKWGVEVECTLTINVSVYIYIGPCHE